MDSKTFWHSESSQPDITVCKNLPKQVSEIHFDELTQKEKLLHIIYKRNNINKLNKSEMLKEFL